MISQGRAAIKLVEKKAREREREREGERKKLEITFDQFPG